MLNHLKSFIMFLSLPAYLSNIMRLIHEGKSELRPVEELEIRTLLWTLIWITIPYWILIGGVGFWFTGTIVYYPFW